MLYKNVSDNKYNLLDKLVSNNIRFAIYRLPQGENICLVIQETNKVNIVNNIAELSNKIGFVIHPFSHSHKHPIVVISADKELYGESAVFEYIEKRKLNTNEDGYYIEDYCNKENLTNLTLANYKSYFDIFASALDDVNLFKLVLSRTFISPRKKTFSIGQSFKNASEKYKGNFTYLFHTPETGTWLGSTPEMILSGERDEWHTVALAGTQIASNKSTEWDRKNIIEQKIVMDFVEEQLIKVGCKYNKSQPLVVNSGNVAHLKSEFNMKLSDKNEVCRLLSLLHPTPAVCGFPQKEAQHFILNNEGYDRQYYSGFVGYVNMDTVTNLYVNLRCMKIEKDSLVLYAGGGILPSSDAETEWQETENKLQNMLSIIHE